MAALIKEEWLDEDGHPLKCQTLHRQQKHKHKQTKKITQPPDKDEDNDDNFLDSSSGDESSPESESDVYLIPNDEIKSALASSKAKSTMHGKKRSHEATVEEVEDEDVSVHSRATSSDPTAVTETMTSNHLKHSNPIYLFYEVVPQNASGQPGDPSDKHYCCRHGNHKTLTVTKLMKSNLNGLIGHMKHFPTMYQLYLVLKNHVELPMAEEIGFASGKTVLDPKGDSEYLKKLEAATENIQKVFAMQQENTAGPWDQAKFEHLLTEWIVACDQPFDEVRKEEFVKLLTYACHPAPSVKLPSWEGI
ncbi:hypothetical protein BJV74DRAFT_878163 [Russula compacta]|nr:hypothetical protein BJV74DRAFT_878163 [Russula compacta]